MQRQKMCGNGARVTLEPVLNFDTIAPCMRRLCAAWICRHEAQTQGGSSELLHIKIKYIDNQPQHQTKTILRPTIHRVPKVRPNLHNLVRLATRKRTDRYINKTTPSYPSSNKFKQGVELYETANMSSEKEVHPKEKLEGTYQGRVQTHPYFLSFKTRRSTTETTANQLYSSDQVCRHGKLAETTAQQTLSHRSDALTKVTDRRHAAGGY